MFGDVLLGAEELATVATVVTPLGEREFDSTRHTAVAAFVFDPVVHHTATGLFGHVPDKHAAFRVANVQALVVSVISNNIINRSINRDTAPPTRHGRSK